HPGRPLGYHPRPGARLGSARPLRGRRVMTSAILTRIRFPFDMLTRLDALATAIRTVIRRKVPRAALIRALVQLHLDTPATSPELAATLRADTVRRGREKGKPKGRRATS